MPTRVIRQPSRPVLFLAFVAALFVACIFVEIADPAPLDVEAAPVAAP